jgi:CPA2 family monovalent cation:H+ antiporter-2
MLFDPASLVRDPLPVLATLFIIVIGKSIAAFLIVIIFRHPIGTALTISASLAQIGEFSFILAELGVGLKLLPAEGRDLILAGAILSILINPLAFAAIGPLQRWLERRRPGALAPTAAPAPAPDDSALLPTTLSDHTILIGYGRVGSLVGKALREAGLPFLVIEDADKPVAELRGSGIETITGNAADGEILRAANPGAARRLVVAIPNAFEAGQIVERARAANATLEIIARAHSDAEVDYLDKLGANTVIMGEREIARGIIDLIGEGRVGVALDR